MTLPSTAQAVLAVATAGTPPTASALALLRLDGALLLDTLIDTGPGTGPGTPRRLAPAWPTVQDRLDAALTGISRLWVLDGQEATDALTAAAARYGTAAQVRLAATGRRVTEWVPVLGTTPAGPPADRARALVQGHRIGMGLHRLAGI
ncbi:hypothetical protein ACQEU5_25175 [Marinactinospora thermotolerans]|uniref:hypothetical protein n=1 Tax=Marinactinospora thermotolerans TaxID=531310 RepID=UPI003D8C7C70